MIKPKKHTATATATMPNTLVYFLITDKGNECLAGVVFSMETKEHTLHKLNTLKYVHHVIEAVNASCNDIHKYIKRLGYIDKKTINNIFNCIKLPEKLKMTHELDTPFKLTHRFVPCTRRWTCMCDLFYRKPQPKCICNIKMKPPFHWI